LLALSAAVVEFLSRFDHCSIHQFNRLNWDEAALTELGLAIFESSIVSQLRCQFNRLNWQMLLHQFFLDQLYRFESGVPSSFVGVQWISCWAE
jgi:hypothetical protein